MQITKIILLGLLTLPALIFGQSRNYKDEFGRKQGIHDGSSGSWLFERTYVNDTLNGFFRQYYKGGTTHATGYYKTGLKDSLWTNFYYDGSVEKKEWYNGGKRNGEFIHYYKDGKVSYQGTFRNDTLLGEAFNYYESGAIKSKGNPKNGLWEEYYENGNLKSRQEFRNGKLWGQRFYFSSEGDTLLPRKVAPQLILNDTTIINNTGLQVYLLYQHNDRNDRRTFLAESLMECFRVCQNDQLTIHVGVLNLQISGDGIWEYEQYDTVCNQSIETIGYTSNFVVKELKNGDYEEGYNTGKDYFKSAVGKIEVERTDGGCLDTGENPVKITADHQTLYFSDIGNLLFFEFDCDTDGVNELYLINYYTCMGQLEIYRIAQK